MSWLPSGDHATGMKLKVPSDSAASSRPVTSSVTLSSWRSTERLRPPHVSSGLFTISSPPPPRRPARPRPPPAPPPGADAPAVRAPGHELRPARERREGGVIRPNVELNLAVVQVDDPDPRDVPKAPSRLTGDRTRIFYLFGERELPAVWRRCDAQDLPARGRFVDDPAAATVVAICLDPVAHVEHDLVACQRRLNGRLVKPADLEGTDVSTLLWIKHADRPDQPQAATRRCEFARSHRVSDKFVVPHPLLQGR